MNFYSYFSTKTYVVGSEMVLSSTQNTFKLMEQIIITILGSKILLIWAYAALLLNLIMLHFLCTSLHSLTLCLLVLTARLTFANNLNPDI